MPILPGKLLRLYWDYADRFLAETIFPENDYSTRFAEKRIVLSSLDIRAGMDFCPALANEHRACRHLLSRKPFHTEPFAA